MITKFEWKCSYMGCRWYKVFDNSGYYASGSYEIVERHSADKYEQSISNPDYWKTEALPSIGTIRREHAVDVELTPETVKAFNEWRLFEHTKSIADMDAQPERYDLPINDPIRIPPQIVTGAVYKPGVGIVAT